MSKLTTACMSMSRENLVAASLGPPNSGMRENCRQRHLSQTLVRCQVSKTMIMTAWAEARKTPCFLDDWKYTPS